jgi:hypothetical protein
MKCGACGSLSETTHKITFLMKDGKKIDFWKPFSECRAWATLEQMKKTWTGQGMGFNGNYIVFADVSQVMVTPI